MAFKMNTSIGKIHAKTQGTKPHAKAIATAQAPKPATGNVGLLLLFMLKLWVL